MSSNAVIEQTAAEPSPRRNACAGRRHRAGTAMAAAAAILALPIPDARAAGPAYCVQYARQAIAQFNRNRTIPGCFKGAGDRWNGDFDSHYGWCITASETDARALESYRDDKLRGCSMRAYGHP